MNRKMLGTWLVSPLLLLLVSTVLPAVVLPRPPSLPNYIPLNYVAPTFHSAKSYIDKGFYQRTNVEKPETQEDYRLLEIEIRDGENVDNLDLQGIVQAVLKKQKELLLPNAQHFDDQKYNITYPLSEILPQSIVGVREVHIRPSHGFYESVTFKANSKRSQYVVSSPEPRRNFGNEKLFYMKKPKVHLNFRQSSGKLQQQDTATGADSRFTLRLEPSPMFRATQPYRMEKKAKSLKSPPKKYDARIHDPSRRSFTTESAMVTSSELPKQIPAPPRRLPALPSIIHTTPVQRYTVRRTDILPEDSLANV